MTPEQFSAIVVYLELACGKPLADTKEAGAARARIYFDLLGDLPYEVLMAAAKRVVLEHPWSTFPSAAELRQAAVAVRQALTVSPAEAWEMAYNRVARNYDPGLTGTFEVVCKGKREAFNSQLEYLLRGLPPLVVEAILSYGAAPLANTAATFARPQFLKIYEQLLAREQRHALLPPTAKPTLPATGKLPPKLLENIGRMDE